MKRSTAKTLFEQSYIPDSELLFQEAAYTVYPEIDIAFH